jgi:hypothetical protein
MKNKIIIALVVIATVGLFSCKSKMSQKMKEDFSQLKTDWGLFSSDLATFGDSLKVNKDKLSKSFSRINKRINKSNQDKMAGYKSASDSIQIALGNTFKDYDASQKSFADSTTAFNAWAAKVDTNKTSDKEVKVPIENYKTYLTNSKAKLQQWNSDMANTMDAYQKIVDDATKIVGTGKDTGDKPKQTKAAANKGKTAKNKPK